MAYPIRHDLEDKTFKVPDMQLVDADFRKIRKEDSAGGHVRFVAERDTKGHADIFWAAALCREAKGHKSGRMLPPRPANSRSASVRRRRALERRNRKDYI